MLDVQEISLYSRDRSSLIPGNQYGVSRNTGQIHHLTEVIKMMARALASF